VGGGGGGGDATYSDTGNKHVKYSTWQNAEFHSVKVGGADIYRHSLKGQKDNYFFKNSFRCVTYNRNQDKIRLSTPAFCLLYSQHFSTK
jgi:hypothetical protein